MADLYVSIVLYKTPAQVYERAIKSVLNSQLNLKLFLVDNHEDERAKSLAERDSRILYVRTGKNLGYGKAHNLALRKAIEDGVKYHLVMNPDTYFEKGTLEKLYEFMEENPEVGLVMPKVLYPDGRLQYLCKLLPAPLDLIGRRFFNWGPFKTLIEKRNHTYELRFTGYNKVMNVPFLSGAFMFMRTEVLKKVGIFDERFFLYCDDLDLSRRIHSVSKTIYYPHCHIYHDWGRGSYKSIRLLLIHVLDAIRYFNKWGWFKDEERERINKETLEKVKGL